MNRCGASKVPRSELVLVTAIALASLAVRAPFAAALDLFQDEAILWWSAVGGLSYCPHPPALQLAMRGMIAAFGETPLAIRFGSLLFGTAGVFMAYVLGRRLYDGRVGLWAAALLAVCPVLLGTGALATPDAALTFLWMLVLYVTLHAYRKRNVGAWILAGLILAVGLHTKYMMALAIPAMFLAVMGESRSWRAVFHRGPWLATAVGLALFVPVFVVWNLGHGWSAIEYHLGVRHRWEISVESLGAYFLGHLLFLSPVLCAGVWLALAAAWRLWQSRGDSNGAWLLAFGLLPILFFVIPSLFTRRELVREHWDAFGYAVGIVALASWVGETDPLAVLASWRRRLVVGAGIVGLIFAGALVAGSSWPSLPARLGLPAPTRKMLGWQELVAAVHDLRQHGDGDAPFLVTESFADAVVLSFYLHERGGIYSLDHRRNARYGMEELMRQWGIDEQQMLRERRGQNAIFIYEYRLRSSGDEDRPKRIYRLFQSVEPARDVSVIRGGKCIRHFGLFHCTQLQ